MQIDWGQIGGAFTAAGVVLGGLMRLWGAIKKKFVAVEQTRTRQITDLKDHMDTTFNKHEALDQQRHGENTTNIKQNSDDVQLIYRMLARAGLNGDR